MIYRYVNTASVGGDGTTRGTTGATSAYNSLRTALSSLPDGNTWTDSYTIRCRGGADTGGGIVVTFGGFHITGYRLVIRGDQGENDSGEGGDAGGTVTDGRNLGSEFFITDGSCYWLDKSAASGRAFIATYSTTTQNDPGTTWSEGIFLIGLQISSLSTNSYEVIGQSYHNLHVESCRIWSRSASSSGVDGFLLHSSAYQRRNARIFNNIIVGAIPTGASGNGTRGVQQQHYNGTPPREDRIEGNIIYGFATGIASPFDFANTNSVIRNNIVMDCTTADYSVGTKSNMTMTFDYNAGEGASAPTGHGANWTQITASTTDFLDYPSAGTRPQTDDVSPSGGSAAQVDAGASLTLFWEGSEDLIETARGATWDVGAFEFVSSGTLLTLTTPTASFAAQSPGVTGLASLTLTKPTVTFTPQNATAALASLLSLSPKALSFSVNSPTVTALANLALSSGTFTLTSNTVDVANSTATEVTLTAQSLSFTANPLTVALAASLNLQAVGFQLTQQQLTATVAALAQLQAAGFTATPQQVSVALASVLALAPSTLWTSARQLTVTEGGAPAEPQSVLWDYLVRALFDELYRALTRKEPPAP